MKQQFELLCEKHGFIKSNNLDNWYCGHYRMHWHELTQQVLYCFNPELTWDFCSLAEMQDILENDHPDMLMGLIQSNRLPLYEMRNIMHRASAPMHYRIACMKAIFDNAVPADLQEAYLEWTGWQES